MQLSEKHQRMLDLVEKHEALEGEGDNIEETLATLVPDPVYVLWDGRRIEGMDAIRTLYTRQRDLRLEAQGDLNRRGVQPPMVPGWQPEPPPGASPPRRGVWVNDDAVILEYLMTHEAPDGTLRQFPLTAVFPFRDGLIVGENVMTVPEYAEIMTKRYGELDF